MAVPVSSARERGVTPLTPPSGSGPTAGSEPLARGGPPSGGARLAVLLAPPLLALFPILSIAADNAGAWTLGDLLTVLAVAAGMAVVFEVMALLGAWLLGRRLEAGGDGLLPRAGVLALAAVGWTFYYVPLQQAVSGVSRQLARDSRLGLVLAAATVALTWWVLRTRRPLAPVGRLACTLGALLVVVSTARAALGRTRGSDVIGRSRVVREFATLPTPIPAAAAGPKRDVYVLLLDSYPNAGVLRESFGYDNRPFLDSLRQLGFVIPARMHSNYVLTMLSLPSLLNFEHMTGLAQDVGTETNDRTVPSYLVQNNRAARFLKAQGYRYLLFPSPWWHVTRASPIADEIHADPHDWSVNKALRSTELRVAVTLGSIFVKLGWPRAEPDVAQPLANFADIAKVPDRPEPTFAFAHFLLPHPPFIFDADCRAVPNPPMVSLDHGFSDSKPQFIAQMRCVNGLTLRTVTALIRKSAVPPIIILVGDHGTLADGWAAPGTPTHDRVVRERTGAFGAFYMPGGGDAEFRDTVSLVNVFRKVLRYYYGVQIPLAPDDAYYTLPEHPYRFERVDPSLIIGG